MKFDCFKIIILIFLIAYDCNIVCNRLRARANRSLMSYLNGLFSPDSKVKLSDYPSYTNNENHENDENYRQINSYNFRFRDDPQISSANIDPPIQNNPRPDNKQSENNLSQEKNSSSDQEEHKEIEPCNEKIDETKEENEKNKIIFQGWLLISSSHLFNRKVFPKVRISQEKEMEIQIDNQKFRVNDAYFAHKGKKSQSSREFWFRLTGRLIYYSATEEDVNILDAISIIDITRISEIVEIFIESRLYFCNDIFDKLNHNWRLCSCNKDNTIKVMCSLIKLIGSYSPQCGGIGWKIEHVIEHTITKPVIIIPTPAPYCNQDWNYQKMGKDWECGCSEGKEQSPIDLPDKLNAIDSYIRPYFSYYNLETKLIDVKNEGDSLNVKHKIEFVYHENNIKIIYDKLGKLSTTDGSTYEAKQIVFHIPAEHTINGKKYDMEIQIIHENLREIAKQATLSFLVEKTPGVVNEFFDELHFLNFVPNPANKEKQLEEIHIPKIFYDKIANENNINPDMKPFSFYTYQGSITFPPCSENTIVYVASKPIRLGSTALELFREALRKPDMKNELGDIITHYWLAISNRVIQQRNGRPIFFFDHEKYCGSDANQEPKFEGHYEKITTNVNKYFYVPGDKPSGLPHSFVVSKNEATGLIPIVEE